MTCCTTHFSQGATYLMVRVLDVSTTQNTSQSQTVSLLPMQKEDTVINTENPNNLETFPKEHKGNMACHDFIIMRDYGYTSKGIHAIVCSAWWTGVWQGTKVDNVQNINYASNTVIRVEHQSVRFYTIKILQTVPNLWCKFEKEETIVWK